MNRNSLVSSCVVVIAFCAGCAGKSLDLGETGAGASAQGGAAGASAQGGAGSSGAGSGGSGASVGGSSGFSGEGGAVCEPSDDPALSPYVSRPAWPDSEVCEPGTLPNLEGIWEGLVQGEPLGPLSGQEVTIEIVGANASGQPCGSVRFGEDTELPPPSDPDDYYPPSAREVLRNVDPFAFGSGELGPLSGTAYTIQDASFDDRRLNLAVAYGEPYRGWCALQQPVPSELEPQSCYNCISQELGEISWTLGEPDSCVLAGTSMSCFRLGMCLNGLCWCSADECEARNLTRLTFDILLDGEEMQGVLGEPARAVWLKRRE